MNSCDNKLCMPDGSPHKRHSEEENDGMVIDETFEFEIEVKGDRANCNETVMTATIGPRRFRVVLMYSLKDLPYK